MEFHESCNYDFVEILEDGSSAHLLCGSIYYNDLESTIFVVSGTSIVIRFISDEIETFTGFKISFFLGNFGTIR